MEIAQQERLQVQQSTSSQHPPRHRQKMYPPGQLSLVSQSQERLNHPLTS